MKVATSRKNKTHNRQWETRPISVCVWLWSSRCFINPYIVKQARNM